MRIRHWAIRFTYSTYIDATGLDLNSLATKLVENNLAVAALHRDGTTVWRSESGIHKGVTTIDLAANHSEAAIRLQPNSADAPNIDGFAQEAWYQAAVLRFFELRALAEFGPTNPNYVRVGIGRLDLVSEHRHTLLFAFAKIYATGIVILEFQIYDPGRSIDLAEFINNYVNLSREGYDFAAVPPAIAKFAPWPGREHNSVWQRAKFWMVQRRHERDIDRLSYDTTDGDFRFSLAPLPSYHWFEERETLTTVAYAVLGCIAFLAGEVRSGPSFVARGHKKLLEWGNFWTGRPHVYLIAFRNMGETAEENAQRYAAEFGMIIARVWSQNSQYARQMLPPDSRAAADYNAYLRESGSLWVWSKSGIRSQRQWADANRGHLIYPHQAVIELIEYGYMLHRKLFEMSASVDRIEETLGTHAELVRLEQAMQESSYYGELRDLLKNAWERLGVWELAERIDRVLALRRHEILIREERVAVRVARGLTLIFGFLAVPPVAESVISPLWKLSGLWLPTDEAAASIFLVGVTILVLAIPIAAILRDLAGS